MPAMSPEVRRLRATMGARSAESPDHPDLPGLRRQMRIQLAVEALMRLEPDERGEVMARALRVEVAA